MFQISHVDVRNRASLNWPYSGHRTTMSVIEPGKTGLIPDIHFVMKMMSGIGPVLSGIGAAMTGLRPMMSGIGPAMSGTGPVMSGIRPKNLITSRTSHIDVRNRASSSWRYYGHQAGHVPDMKKGRLGYLIQYIQNHIEGFERLISS